MHILFLHINFPAQFGQIAMHLAQQRGYQCTFVSECEVEDTKEIRHVRFETTAGATDETQYCVRSFENQTARSYAAFEALRQRPDIRPDLIVAHSGFVSSLFLRELYPEVPQIGYFEYFYYANDSDIDFRHDLPRPETIDFLRVRVRNAQLLLDLHNCDAGYCPTLFQRSQLPIEYQPKVETIFDGIDTQFWCKRQVTSRTFGGVTIPPNHRLVTYVSRGFEATRGSDIFLRAADMICRERPDVTVLVVGEDRIAYGGDMRFTGGKTFRQWTVDRYRPDLSRIHFIGRLPPSQLVQLLSLSDLHIYLTVPFVLSWSLMNALSCECTILASDTAPVREMIRPGATGVLSDFFDHERFAQQGLEILATPNAFRELGPAGRAMIEKNYSIPVCLARMEKLYDRLI